MNECSIYMEERKGGRGHEAGEPRLNSGGEGQKEKVRKVRGEQKEGEIKGKDGGLVGA